MTKAEIIRAIFNSDMSAEDVDDILEACNDAKRTLDAKLFRELGEGDIVKVKGPTKPKYMEGRTGQVVKTFRRGQGRALMVEVQFAEAMGKFGSKVSVPIGMLRKVG
jgi:hypothetical protein